MNQNSENISFSEQLDQLITLFKKVQEKARCSNTGDENKVFSMNFDMIMRNYEVIKESVPKETLDNLGSPFKKLIIDMIEQLKEDFGEEFLSEIEEYPKLAEMMSKEEERQNEIKLIDEKLKNPSLKSYEIDELLDRRSELLLYKIFN